MASWQKVTIVGHVGLDPVVSSTSDGRRVANFNLAVTEKWGAADARKESTTWFQVSVWGDQVDVIARYVRKGGLVLVEGKVSVQTYVAKNGQAAAALKVLASDVRFLSAPARGEVGAGNSPESAAGSAPARGEVGAGNSPESAAGSAPSGSAPARKSMLPPGAA